MQEPPTPTISDVAKRAGVSIATVSRYVRGHQVRKAEDIEQAVKALGFRPSAAARSLRSGVTRTIGVVVPDITNPYFAAVVKGVESASESGDHAYNILLASTDENVAREHRILDGLAGRVDGLILGPVTVQAETLEGLRRLNVPLVILDRGIEEGDAFDAVLVDNVGGAKQAGDYLVSLGHERIGFIGGPLNTTPGRGRHDGFVDALAAADIELPESYIEFGDFREDSGYQATLRLLAAKPIPTALFSANNLMTIGALRALHDMGVRVPDNVSLIGFDDMHLGNLLNPPLTVIDRPMAEQGRLAMTLLLNRLNGDMEPTARKIVLDTRLKVRGSCAAPPGKDVRSDRAAERHQPLVATDPPAAATTASSDQR